MKRFNATFAALVCTTMITGGSAAWASQEPEQRPQPAPEIIQEPDVPEERTATGELVSVDADSEMLTIKGADGSEWNFRYTEDTEVSGAQQGVAGLATKAGTRVTVHYTGDGEVKTATRISVAE